MSSRVVAAWLSALAVLAVGCSAEGGSSATTAPNAGVSTDSTVIESADPTSSAGSAATTGPGSPVELTEVAEFGVVTLGEVEPGPHPVLGWEPFEGASSYWLVVVDAAGDPYWAWTGKDSSVRVGGGSTDEINQTAVVHEAMTWRVAAFDENGTLVALSQSGTIFP